jgi:hypothetical protein
MHDEDSGRRETALRLTYELAYDREFLVHTLSTTCKGTAEIAPGRGVKIHNLYYWTDAFRAPDVEKLPRGFDRNRTICLYIGDTFENTADGYFRQRNFNGDMVMNDCCLWDRRSSEMMIKHCSQTLYKRIGID